jgi:hypothetical protein
LVKIGEKRHAYRIFVENPSGKCPFGKWSRRCESNFKIDLRDIGCEDGRWMELDQEPVKQ